MKKDNLQPRNILMGVLVAGLILIGMSFFRQLNFADNSQVIKRGEKIELVDGDVLEQKFVAQHNGLSKIGILFGNRKLQEGSNLNFVLADKNCQKSFFKKTLKGEHNFDSKYLYNFTFPKVDNSKGKGYCLKIGLEVEKEWSLWRKIKGKIKPEKKTKVQKIRLFEQLSDRRGVAGYILLNKSDKVKNKGSKGVAFTQSYQNKSFVKSFRQLNQRMSQYKPWFLKGGYLMIIFWLAIIFSLIGFVMIVRYKK